MLIPIGFFGAGGAATSFDLISTTVLSSSTASVTFDVSSLATTYKHLEIRFVTKGASTTPLNNYFRMNSDSGSNYSWHGLTATGSGVASFAYTSWNSMSTGVMPSTSAANSFSAGIISLIDPFSTTKFKTVRTLAGSTNDGNQVRMTSNAWLSTSAITSITFFPETTTSSNNYLTGSRFSIYGIKG